MSKELSKSEKDTIVKYNIEQAKNVVSKAERVNKGIYSHNINHALGKIKPLLNKKCNYDSEEFKIICKLKQRIAAMLYYLEHNL